MLDTQPFERDYAGDAVQRLYEKAPGSVAFKKLRKRLLRDTQEAISRYAMLAKPGGRWLVCLSGGKDSHALLALLLDLKWRGALDVDLLACNLDQGQPGFPSQLLPDYLQSLGVPFRIERRDTYSVVVDKIPEGRTYCSLCSRLRRGHLYRIAREEGCDAIVLGHHRDDALETFLLNLFYGGRLAAMAPKLLNDEGDIHVLRPLILSSEDDIARFAKAMGFPVIPCDLCGSQDGLKRQAMKRLLDDWEKEHPGRRETMFRALQNVRPGQLADPGLWDFARNALSGASHPEHRADNAEEKA
ncbi:MAG: tRNA 2-thiocytidine(32) synthetase TtcA [Alphaproteobacteria bacterium]|nr:tRNA 2-thiocytidine(32) synthetase TtcA [Alphaproteobacteria bacterium]